MNSLRANAADLDLGRVISGEKAAWDQFVENFAGLLYGVVTRTLRAHAATHSTEDAKDVVQDVFLRLVKDDFRLLRTYDPQRASIATWLTVVARSATIDLLRRPESRRDTVELDDTLSAGCDVFFGGRLDLPPGILSERQAQILRMLFDEDMDVTEVAGALRVQAQTVRSLKHQAILKLREHFGVSGGV